MNAFVSVVNDTPYPWHCKVIEKEEAPTLTWLTMHSTVVAAVTASLAISPALQVGTNAHHIRGVPQKFLVQDDFPLAVGVVSNNSSRFSAALTEGMTNYLKDKGYELYKPGEKLKTVPTDLNVHIDCKKVISAVANGVLRTLGNDVFTNKSEGSANEFSMKQWTEIERSKTTGFISSVEIITGSTVS